MHDRRSRGRHPYRPFATSGGWVVADPMFRLLVDLEVEKARRLRYCVSLVCLAAESAAPSLADAVTRALRSTDVVTPRTPASLAALLVDAEATHLPSILQRLTTRLETRAWSAGGSCYPTTAARAEDLLRDADALMVRAKEEGGNRLYVAS